MRKYVGMLTLLTCLTLLSCSFNSPNELMVIDFSTAMDQNFEVGKSNYKEVFNITVIDAKDIRAFIIPFQNTRSETELQANGDVKKGVTTYDTTFVYCIYRKGNKIGLRYDSLKAISPQRFPVDSLLSRINIGKEQLHWNAIAEGKLIYSQKDKKTGKVLEERYISNKDGVIDSTYRYFDHSMESNNFSLAPSIDKKYNTKLAKIINIKKSIKNNVRNVLITEMKMAKLKSPETAIKLIERFKSDSESHKLN